MKSRIIGTIIFRKAAIVLGFAALTLCGTPSIGLPQDSQTKAPPADTPPVTPPPSTPTSPTVNKDAAPPSEPKSNKPAFAVLLKDATRLNGLIPLHRKDDKVYAEVADSLLGKELFVLISIARGIGERSVLGGMSWNDGDDWIWQFRKVDDNIQVVRKNVRFFADKGTPEEKAVDLAYTDSVLFSVPIVTVAPSGAHVIDLTAIFFNDLPQISSTLPGFSFARDRSSWARVKAFPDNIELEVAATYGSSGAINIDTVADSRGVTINVHYSISLLPQNGYKPRLADARVGYFVTALKNRLFFGWKKPFLSNTDRLFGKVSRLGTRLLPRRVLPVPSRCDSNPTSQSGIQKTLTTTHFAGSQLVLDLRWVRRGSIPARARFSMQTSFLTAIFYSSGEPNMKHLRRFRWRC